MLDKEKLIIVFHLGVAKLSKQEMNKLLVQFVNSKQMQFDESVRTIVLPDATQQAVSVRVEVVNPMNITDDEYNAKVVPYCKAAEQAIKDLNDKTNE